MKRSVACTLGVLLLAGCAGGAGSVPGASSAKPQSKTAPGSVVISIPIASTATQASSRNVRYPQFVSPNASSVALSINGGGDTLFDVSATSSLCTTVAGSRNCTLAFAAPAGDDTFAFIIFQGINGSGNALASATTSQIITSGQPFNFAVALNATIGTIVVNIPTGGGTQGTCPDGLQTFNGVTEGCAGSSGAVTFTVDDPSGAAITGTAPFATPITITTNDPSVTASPNQITAPGGSTVFTYTGALLGSAIANAITVNLTIGTQVIQAPLSTRRTNLYVANSNSPPGTGAPAGNGNIAVFQFGAAGAASPIRTIAGNNTGLFFPVVPLVDAAGFLYVLDDGTGSNPVILVFAPGANGNVAPVRQITNIAALDSTSSCNGMVFDPTMQFLMVTCGTGIGSFIYAFPIGSNGPATSAVTASTRGTTFDVPSGMAFDQTGGIYVAEVTNFSIYYFPGPVPVSGGLGQSLGAPIGQLGPPGSFPSSLTPISVRVDGSSGTVFTSVFFLNATAGAPDSQAEIGIWKPSILPCTNCAPSGTMTGTPFTTHATSGLTFDPAGNMYTIDPYTDTIIAFSRATVAAASSGITTNPAPLLTLNDESAPGLGALGMMFGP